MQAAPGPALVCRPLAALAPHLFTTRAWRLGSIAAGAGAETADGWAQVAAAMGVEAGRLVRVAQVHGVAVSRAGQQAPRQADIILNDAPGLVSAVQAADCVPLLLADETTGAVAAVHSGWRGTVQRAAIVAVEAMTRAFGTRPEDLVAAIGPSIGACCYEVGADVRNAFARAGFADGDTARWFFVAPRQVPGNPSMAALSPTRRADHWFFDGWTAVADQLRSAGMREERIHVAALCTASHPETLCSYRRDGSPAGRLAAAIAPAVKRPG